MVDIVSERLLITAMKKWPLLLESRIGPVTIVGRYFRDLHEIDQISTPLPLRASQPNNIVANCRALADLRFGCRKRADTIERIGRKPVVVVQHITKQSHGGTRLSSCVAGYPGLPLDCPRDPASR